MPMIPAKFSKRWVWIALIYFIILLILFCTAQFILYGTVSARPLIGLAVLSALLALITGGSGYFGGRLFAVALTAGVLIGAGYMIATAITQRTSGWADLAGLAGFLSFATIGLIAGLVLQLTAYLRRKLKERPRKKRESTDRK